MVPGVILAARVCRKWSGRKWRLHLGGTERKGAFREIDGFKRKHIYRKLVKGSFQEG